MKLKIVFEENVIFLFNKTLKAETRGYPTSGKGKKG